MTNFSTYGRHINLLSSNTVVTRLNTICDFRPKSPFISETVQDTTMITMDR